LLVVVSAEYPKRFYFGKLMSESRKYPSADVKILYAKSAGLCSFANCRRKVVLPDSPDDKSKQAGKIAHIVAHSPDGPRADESYPKDKLDSYENWVLLCPWCHDIVDAQPLLYTTDHLREIKRFHEVWVEGAIDKAMSDVTFAELEIAAKAIASGAHYAGGDFTVIPPEEKIKKNSLTSISIGHIITGLSKSTEVERFLSSMALLDSEFPERLKDGFKHRYLELRQVSAGDALFMEMFSFATKGFKGITESAAGLAILVHLFHLCEIFEK